MTSQADIRASDDLITLLLCGDVMTGRGIDQILPHPGDPRLHEAYVRDAREYWRLAEKAHGPISRPVTMDYVWGDALAECDRARPDVVIVNLETAVTVSDHYWKGKEVHYRMSPRNVGCLRAARIDCCALANNHVVDWGHEGLTETLQSLRRAGLKTAGAGDDQSAAAAPATLEVGAKSRILVFSFGSDTSGIPPAWSAGDQRPGVNLLPDLSDAAAERVGQTIAAYRRAGDVIVASLHWGGNWGYAVPAEQRRFAQQLVERAGVDLVHGHSSHHTKGIEVYRDRLILYGCGDFLTDYEGIPGYQRFRGDLAIMYFASIQAASGRLIRLLMRPLQVHRMRLRRASAADARWLWQVLDREGRRLGTHVSLAEDDALTLQWRTTTQ